MNYTEITQLAGLIILIDFEKAYDSHLITQLMIKR